MNDSCTSCSLSETATRSLEDSGARMTTLRRDVLHSLHHADKPVGAYDLFGQLKQEGKASAPPAVYRVLDFLVEQGLAHKLSSLRAYAACRCAPHEHQALFLICSNCGSVEECADADMTSLLAAASSRGFSTRDTNVEITGICRDCVAH